GAQRYTWPRTLTFPFEMLTIVPGPVSDAMLAAQTVPFVPVATESAPGSAAYGDTWPPFSTETPAPASSAMEMFLPLMAMLVGWDSPEASCVAAPVRSIRHTAPCEVSIPGNPGSVLTYTDPPAPIAIPVGTGSTKYVSPSAQSGSPPSIPATSGVMVTGTGGSTASVLICPRSVTFMMVLAPASATSQAPRQAVTL